MAEWHDDPERAAAPSRPGASRLQRTSAWFLATVVCALIAFTSPLRAQKFETIAPHVLLMEFPSRAILMEKAPDEPIAPASLVKLMTAAVVFEEIRRGRIKLTDEFVVSENAWRKGGAPSRGSTMFLPVKSSVSVADLLTGLIVLSGNDAAIVLAEGVSGSEENFARLMTDRAREIGLPVSTFRNASGVGDSEQKSTTRELAMLAAYLIATYPDQYPLFGLKEFTFNKIRQLNRNPLLTMDIGADGLKTGNITESGYNLVGSAQRDGRRLILVVTGLKTAGDRAQEARKILDWGFRAFEQKKLFLAGAEIGSVDIFGGDTGSVPVGAASDIHVLVPRGARERIQAQIVYRGPVLPPIAKGQKLAVLRVRRGELSALEVPLVALADVGSGGLTRRAADAGVEFARLLFRRMLQMVRG